MPAKNKLNYIESVKKYKEKCKLYEKNLEKYEDIILFMSENEEKKGIEIHFRDNSKIFLKIKKMDCFIDNEYSQAKQFELFLNSLMDRKEQIDFIFQLFLKTKDRFYIVNNNHKWNK